MFKVIVAGSRTYNDYQELNQVLNEVLVNKKPDIEIVSGGARGADSLGERYAKDNDYQLKIFPADWDIYGKAAGYIRNEQMARYADACIVFWDGVSSGSGHMIDLAKKYNLPLYVYLYRQNNNIITELKPNQIFVFGSNLAGIHGKGAALTAQQKFGAEYGKGIGLTGRCYAIPTKDYSLNTLPLSTIKSYIEDFVIYAEEHKELEFLLTPVGTGLAGYTLVQLESILPELPSNVIKLF